MNFAHSRKNQPPQEFEALIMHKQITATQQYSKEEGKTINNCRFHANEMWWMDFIACIVLCNSLCGPNEKQKKIKWFLKIQLTNHWVGCTHHEMLHKVCREISMACKSRSQTRIKYNYYVTFPNRVHRISMNSCWPQQTAVSVRIETRKIQVTKWRKF